MQRLFLFLYQYRAFLAFLFLEIFCVMLIVRNNRFQGAKYFNSSNRFSASLLQVSTGVSDYFRLKSVNTDLAAENAALRREIQQYKQSLYKADVLEISNSEIINKYDLISAKVIKNSTRNVDNFITIDKGRLDGVKPGMGAIDGRGVVGKVKSVSRNFSTITSVLHSDILISSKIRRTGDLCTTSWNTLDPQIADLEFVPLHVKLEVGDTIVTSGYGAVFPEGEFVGTIEKFEVREDAIFYDIDVQLGSDFNTISYVYLVKNNMKPEQDSLLLEIGEVDE